VFCPCRSALVGPNHHSAKKDFDHEIMENEKSCDFDHEIMNLIEKNVGAPAILGKALSVLMKHELPKISRVYFWI
jgi:hypothetical protein